MDISTSSPLVSGVNNFPQPLEVTPNGTVLNMHPNSGISELQYLFNAGAFFLSGIQLQISTASRTATADYITLNIPGPAQAISISQLASGSGMYTSVIQSQTNQAINTYIASTPASGVVSVTYSGNARVGTWTVTIQGTAPDTMPITYGTPTTVLPAGNVVVNTQVNAVDTFGNVYFWGDNTGTYDIVRPYTYIVGTLVNVNGAMLPMMLIDGVTNPSDPVYLRVDRLGYQFNTLALQQIASNPAATPYLSLFPVIPFNPLHNDQVIEANGLSLVFGRYVYSATMYP